MKTTATLRHLALALSLGACALTQTLAAVTDLANAPLSSTQANAKPNLMFILDASGSMAQEFMPDDVATAPRDVDYTSLYGFRAAQCNGLAYNPAITYKPPVTPQGVSYPNMVPDGVWGDGYQPNIGSSPARLRSGNALDMSANPTTGVTKILTITGSPDSSTVSGALSQYRTNMVVAISSHEEVGEQTYGAAAHWMLGTVTAVTSSTITVSVTFSTSDGNTSYNRWLIGSPASGTLRASYYYTYSGTQPKLGWTYSSAGKVITTSTFYNECKASSGSSVFTKVMVSDLSAAQQTNYANWYGYYRSRILAIRSAAGSSFSSMSDNFRVGFTVISDPYAVNGTNGFVSANDFTSTQKTSFYKSLYSAPPSGSTPLRASLSKVGRYYGNVAPGQTGRLVGSQTSATPDPVQFSCQRNYTLLSTDGYWNTGLESSSYGPLKLDGVTKVGQQDGFDLRPQYDGSVTTRKVTYNFGYTFAKETPITLNYATPYTSIAEVTTYSTRQLEINLGTKKNPNYIYYTLYKKVVTNQNAKASLPSYDTTTETQNYKAQQTRTVTELNGVQVSDTTSPVDGPTITAVGSATRTTPVAGGTGTQSAWTTTGSAYQVFDQTCVDYPAGNCATYQAEYTRTGGQPETEYKNPTPGSRTKVSETPGIATERERTPFETDPVETITTTGGSESSLADVAEYYYVTPFRTSSTVNCVISPTNSHCKGDLSPAGIDTATYQHMTTFTLGLGVNGQFKYDPKYLSQTSGDYFNVTRGKDDSGNVVNWPAPYIPGSLGQDIPGKTDDLWHAAVNGRGQYFSSSDTDSLKVSIDSMLTTVIEASGYGGSAAASSLKPVLGTDLVFLASYTTVTWAGDVKAFKLSRNANNDVVPVEQVWSAADALNGRTYTDRKIYYAGQVSSGSTTNHVLKAFTYSNLSGDNLNSHFDNVCNKNPAPVQCATLSEDLKTMANTGSNVVNFIRGSREQEISISSAKQPFRTRSSVLGDVINASPVFVGAPPFQYADSGYAEHVATRTSRKKVIYTAANDGMLHAFSGEAGASGAELWAFIPTAVIPNLYRLVDTNYANAHQYFVDGSPVVGDVYDGSNWRTILVGGLNKGGKSYYALDVTDPDSPSLLWEVNSSQSQFSNLGYTYGNPLITKVKDPSDSSRWIWAVAFASGHNNVGDGGDGNGTLYVVNAVTGARLYKIDTTYVNASNQTTKVGSSSTPSGLAKINAWITAETNNQAERFYGGDLLGNLWRFDVNGLIEPKNSALRLAQFKTSDSSSDAQPIMARPELAEVNYGGAKHTVVLVGTGQYLGTTDLQDPSDATAAVQAIYAIKDPLTSTGWGPLRGGDELVTQTLVTGSDGTTRTIAQPAQTVDWGNKAGWTIALPTAKERVAIDMNLQYNTLGVISHVPTGTPCSPSGKSWVYFLNVSNGAGASATTVVGNQITSGLGTGITWFDLGNGESTVLVPDDKLGIHAEVPPVAPPSTTGAAKRVSWRELVN